MTVPQQAADRLDHQALLAGTSGAGSDAGPGVGQQQVQRAPAAAGVNSRGQLQQLEPGAAGSHLQQRQEAQQPLGQEQQQQHGQGEQREVLTVSDSEEDPAEVVYQDEDGAWCIN